MGPFDLFGFRVGFHQQIDGFSVVVGVLVWNYGEVLSRICNKYECFCIIVFRGLFPFLRDGQSSTGPEVSINTMIKSRSRGTHRCYESLVVAIEWSQCFDPSIGPVAHWPVLLP